MKKNHLKKDIDKALNDPILRGALGRFGEAYPIARENVMKTIDFEALRTRMKEIKQDVAARIEELADQFEQQVIARGGIVVRAKNGEDAKRYILDLAKQRGVKTICKAKSMASEEIHLNQYLQKEGLEVVETDLGEWIIQQAGQRPSHMVMPAIHMNKEQVAGEFSKTLKREIPPDIPTLVKVARKELRKKFLIADMGISGANIAVAETGTVVLFTNEGNARLSSTMPPIHVVLVGYEKLVPSFADVETVCKLLPRSATAQMLTSYVTMITGQVPTLDKDSGKEIPKELHVILLDNGRLNMAHDPVLKEAIQCIRCAACLNVCPVYQLIGGHVYGHIYAGGIGSILTAFFNSMEEAKDSLNLCIQCRRCTETCPGKIDIPHLILELRARLVKENSLPFVSKTIFEQVLSDRRRFHTLLRLAAKVQGPVTKGTPFIRHLPLFFKDMAEFRSLPAITETPFRDQVKVIKQKVAKQKGTVALFAGCMVDFVYPEIGEAMVKVLNKYGYRVVFPEGQNCCGAPAIYSGDISTGIHLAKQNIEAMELENVDYIVSGCPTCTEALAGKFKELLKDDAKWQHRADKVSQKAIDFVKLVDQLKPETTSHCEAPKVTYHTSCHLKRSMGIYDEPRRVLNNAGCTITEMKDNDRCCGLGGSYAIKFPQISAPILERKLDNIEASGADAVVMDCPGCVMQIKGGLDKRNSSMRAKHTAEILAEQL